VNTWSHFHARPPSMDAIGTSNSAWRADRSSCAAPFSRRRALPTPTSGLAATLGRRLRREQAGRAHGLPSTPAISSLWKRRGVGSVVRGNEIPKQ
jgi:hypothetical protein